MSAFVAYYWVSTDRMGESGLGLEAQLDCAVRFTHCASQLSEFQEIESGKRHTNRPQLAAALDQCRRHKATLVIARLDRLARNAHFISRTVRRECAVLGQGTIHCRCPAKQLRTLHRLSANVHQSS
jgi:DNA invertase Pin-like site-specific DNA recombinase